MSGITESAAGIHWGPAGNAGFPRIEDFHNGCIFGVLWDRSWELHDRSRSYFDGSLATVGVQDRLVPRDLHIEVGFQGSERTQCLDVHCTQMPTVVVHEHLKPRQI